MPCDHTKNQNGSAKADAKADILKLLNFTLAKQHVTAKHQKSEYGTMQHFLDISQDKANHEDVRQQVKEHLESERTEKTRDNDLLNRKNEISRLELLKRKNESSRTQSSMSEYTVITKQPIRYKMPQMGRMSVAGQPRHSLNEPQIVFNKEVSNGLFGRTQSQMNMTNEKSLQADYDFGTSSPEQFDSIPNLGRSRQVHSSAMTMLSSMRGGFRSVIDPGQSLIANKIYDKYHQLSSQHSTTVKQVAEDNKSLGPRSLVRTRDEKDGRSIFRLNFKELNKSTQRDTLRSTFQTTQNSPQKLSEHVNLPQLQSMQNSARRTRQPGKMPYENMNPKQRQIFVKGRKEQRAQSQFQTIDVPAPKRKALPQNRRVSQPTIQLDPMVPSKKEKEPELTGIDIATAKDPINQNLTQLIKHDIENKKNVKQNQHHLQYAILEAKKEFENSHGLGNKMNNVTDSLAKGYSENRENCGPRHNFQKLREYVTEDKDNLERFYIQANMFDPRFELLSGQQKQFYQGKTPINFITANDSKDWMQKRKLGDHYKEELAQKEFIKDIFVAMDEDGSSTMELDELIKGLLSLNLSQDIDFAKQVIVLFEDNKSRAQSTKNTRFRLYDENVKTKSESNEFLYSFKDFLAIFKTDKIGQNIIKIINEEIEYNNKKKILVEKQQELANKMSQTISKPNQLDKAPSFLLDGVEMLVLQKKRGTMSISNGSFSKNMMKPDLNSIVTEEESDSSDGSGTLGNTSRKINFQNQESVTSEYSEAPKKPILIAKPKQIYQRKGTVVVKKESLFGLQDKQGAQNGVNIALADQSNSSMMAQSLIQRGSTLKRPEEIKIVTKFMEKENSRNLKIAMKEIYQGIQNKIGAIQKKVGPQTGDQRQIIIGWWNQMARLYNDDADPNFINVLPVKLVTEFLIKKGIVMTENHAHYLYRISNITTEDFKMLKQIIREDFNKMFIRVIFIHALIKVIQQIDKTGGTAANTDRKLVKLIPLPLKINQFERQHIMNALNPQSQNYEKGQRILSSLLTIMDRTNEERAKHMAPGAKKKHRMTYQEFIDDPFGIKKKQIQDYYQQQRKGVKAMDFKEEEDDNLFGQLNVPINLAEAPKQPDNIQNRMLNQIFIANKQHMDQKPMLTQEMDLDKDHFMFDKIQQEMEFQNKVIRIMKKDDPLNEMKIHDGSDTFQDLVIIPSSKKTQEKQRIISKNFNLRNLQQIVGDYHSEDL